MKAGNVLILDRWVKGQTDYLSGDRATLTEVARFASEKLGFKVSTNALRDVMLDNGIPTRKQPKAQSERMALLAENERLQAENNQLKQRIAKVIASDYLPEELKDLLYSGLSAELREAIQEVCL